MKETEIHAKDKTAGGRQENYPGVPDPSFSFHLIVAR